MEYFNHCYSAEPVVKVDGVTLLGKAGYAMLALIFVGMIVRAVMSAPDIQSAIVAVAGIVLLFLVAEVSKLYL